MIQEKKLKIAIAEKRTDGDLLTWRHSNKKQKIIEKYKKVKNRKIMCFVVREMVVREMVVRSVRDIICIF